MGSLEVFQTYAARAYRWPDGCLLLLDMKRSNTQGHIKVRCNGKVQWVHRVAFEAFNAPLKKGERVMHQCDMSCCIAPAHLKRGSSSDNNRETHSRGRMHLNAYRNLKGHWTQEMDELMNDGIPF